MPTNCTFFVTEVKLLLLFESFFCCMFPFLNLLFVQMYIHVLTQWISPCYHFLNKLRIYVFKASVTSEMRQWKQGVTAYFYSDSISTRTILISFSPFIFDSLEIHKEGMCKISEFQTDPHLRFFVAFFVSYSFAGMHPWSWYKFVWMVQNLQMAWMRHNLLYSDIFHGYRVDIDHRLNFTVQKAFPCFSTPD